MDTYKIEWKSLVKCFVTFLSWSKSNLITLVCALLSVTCVKLPNNPATYLCKPAASFFYCTMDDPCAVALVLVVLSWLE